MCLLVVKAVNLPMTSFVCFRMPCQRVGRIFIRRNAVLTVSTMVTSKPSVQSVKDECGMLLNDADRSFVCIEVE